ncbi:phosphoribosyltransferase [Archaeoglobus veneficus]|uniref:Phosphoribosyltransferase n=1 Tax=Archaeoglobus veneficus (strain DSM 11195 / SNP6) TaxID=693661 RepID=F2KPX6_ARCVS|nr:phosphoribosyltransferase [Archaeoglobus veneficus]AEA46483.1 phosphoribosyltransferase [Archaeoglobus veneficus SNP6]
MGITTVLLTWDHVYRLCLKLAGDIRKSGFSPEAIVAVGRGGWVPARILSDTLDIRNLYSVKAEHWDVAEKREDAVITQPLNADISGMNVLVVDDVTDTGKTMDVVVQHVKELGANETKTAVLHHKNTSSFRPDFAAEILDEWIWIVYPWGVFETILGFLPKIPASNVEEIREHLKINFNLDVDPEIINRALEIYSETRG